MALAREMLIPVASAALLVGPAVHPERLEPLLSVVGLVLPLMEQVVFLVLVLPLDLVLSCWYPFSSSLIVFLSHVYGITYLIVCKVERT